MRWTVGPSTWVAVLVVGVLVTVMAWLGQRAEDCDGVFVQKWPWGWACIEEGPK